jgi:hypothetical protein
VDRIDQVLHLYQQYTLFHQNSEGHAEDMETLKGVYQSSLNIGLAGAPAGLPGNSHGTRGSFQVEDATEREKAPNRGAFKRRGSFTKVSSTWTYNKELFEILNGRTRFFFDNPDKPSMYPVLNTVVAALQGSVVKLGGNDGPGQLLLMRAETQLEASFKSPKLASVKEPSTTKPKLLGLYGFLRDSLDVSTALTAGKGGNTAPPTPSGGSNGASVDRLSPVLALSSPVQDLSSTSNNPLDIPEVMLRVDTVVSSVKPSSEWVARSSTYLSVVEPEQLSQLQKLGGNRVRPFNSGGNAASSCSVEEQSEIGVRQFRRFEGVALIPYDVLVRSMAFRAAAATADGVSGKSTSGESPSNGEIVVRTVDVVTAPSPMSTRRTGAYMHPVESIVTDVLEDLYTNKQRRFRAPEGGDAVVQATMPLEQDRRVKGAGSQPAPGLSSRQNSMGRVIPAAVDLTVNTAVAISKTLSASPGGSGATATAVNSSIPTAPQWVADELNIDCVGVQIQGSSLHTLSDFGYRQLLAESLHE